MAVTYVGVSNAAGQASGSAAASTVSITPTLPGSSASGDRVFVVQVHSCASGSGTTPTNWTVLGTKDTAIASALGAVSSGGGQRYMTVYYRDYDGSWSMPAFTLTSVANNSHWIGAVSIRRSHADYTWATPTISSAASDTGTANTVHSAATSSSFATTSNAFLIVGQVNNDNVTATTGSITQTSGTFGTFSERADGGTGTGNIVSGKVYTTSVTTGATNTVTIANTLNASSQGGNLIVQQTEVEPVAGPAISTFVDNCTTYDTAKWNTTAGSDPTISSGRYRFTTSADNTIQMDNYYDLTGGNFSFRVDAAANSFNSANAFIAGIVKDEYALGSKVATPYYFRFTSNGTTTVTVQAYRGNALVGSTRTHTSGEYYRIREASGTLYWEYASAPAAGGTISSWSTLHSQAGSYLHNYYGRAYGVFSHDWTSSVSTISVDDINTGGPDGPAISTLSDGFAGSINGATWDATSFSYSSGTALASVSSAAATASLITDLFYNITGDSVQWRQAQASASGTGQVTGGVRDASNAIWALRVTASGVCQAVVNSTGEGPTRTHSNGDRYRVRMASTTIYFEYSTNGVSWTALHSTTTLPGNTNRVKVYFHVFNVSGTTISKLDDVNVLPGLAVSTLTDAFSTIDTGKWTPDGASGYSITSDSGAAKLEYATAAYASAYLTSVDTYNLIGSQAVVEIPDIGTVLTDTTSAARLYFLDQSDPNNSNMRLYVSANYGIVAQLNNSGSLDYNNGTGSGTYSTTTHRWLRIRESSGTIYFDTSPDGSSWTNAHSFATSLVAWDLTNVLISLEVQRGAGAGGSPGYVKFDNFNLPPALPAEQLEDHFGDVGASDLIWSYELGISAFILQGIAYVGAYPGLVSTNTWDLTDSQIHFELKSYDIDAGEGVFCVFGDEGLAEYLMVNVDGTTIAYENDTATISSSTTYDAVAHRFIRFRHSGSTAYIEASSDGLSWSTLPSGSGSYTPNPNMHMWFFTTGTGDGAVIDNVNTLPPTAPAGTVVQFDAYTAGAANVTSWPISYSHTVTGTDRALLVPATTDTAGSVSGVTYNGVSLTLLAGPVNTGSWKYNVYGLLNPPAGTYNVVLSGSGNGYSEALSFTGVASFGDIDSNGTGADVTVDTSLGDAAFGSTLGGDLSNTKQDLGASTTLDGTLMLGWGTSTVTFDGSGTTSFDVAINMIGVETNSGAFLQFFS